MILRPRHFKAIDLLVGTDLLQRDVAREVGIAPRTFGHWLKDPAFQAELARRREAMPRRLDGLRMQTVRSLLVNVIRRLDDSEENPPLKEITQLLSRVAGDGFAASKTPEADQPNPDEQHWPELTPEQVDAIWDVIDNGRTPAEAESGPRPGDN